MVGPLLFLIYVNSLPCQITEGLLLQQYYADDTTLICSGPNPEAAASAMDSQLKLLNQWAIDSRMRMNYSKVNSYVVQDIQTKPKTLSSYYGR